MDISARMLIFSFLSCLDCGQTEPAKLEKDMADLLDKTKGDLGFSEIAWGPIACKADHEIFTDALIFAVKEAGIPGRDEYTVVFRGTNPLSLSSWLFQDLDVAGLVPWSRRSANTKATNAFISKATDTSLAIHTGLTSKGKTLLDWLIGLAESGKKTVFNITGHSLGGCMSATFAQLLYDELNHRALLGNASVKAYPFAGPSAGDEAFSDYSTASLGFTRYANGLDIVTHAWVQEDMAGLKGIYGSIAPNDVEASLIDGLNKRIQGMRYAQPGACFPIHSEICGLWPFTEFMLQAAFQHVLPYLQYAAKQAPVALIKVILDIVESLLRNDESLFPPQKAAGSTLRASRKPSPSLGAGDFGEGKQAFFREIETRLLPKR